MIAPARSLESADSPALDALLAGWPLPAVYARSYLRQQGIHGAGLRGIGCPAGDGAAPAALAAALTSFDGIAWPIWTAPAQLAALAAGLPLLSVTLLSGPRPLVEPLLARLPPALVGGGDHCPFQRLTPAALVAAPAGPGPQPRRATHADMERLIDFYIRGFYSLAHLPTRDAWRARLTEQLDYRTLYLIEEDGVVVSAALSSAETPAAAMIGGVATVAAYRNRGLSARCVHALCTALFAAGVGEIGLFYLPDNAPAARVYTKLGFLPVGEWWLQRVNYW